MCILLFISLSLHLLCLPMAPLRASLQHLERMLLHMYILIYMASCMPYVYMPFSLVLASLHVRWRS